MYAQKPMRRMHQRPPQSGAPKPQKKRGRTRKNRWYVLGVIAAVAGVAWFVRGIDALPWRDVMDLLRVKNCDEYSYLAVLGLLLIAITAALRVRDDDGRGQ